MWGYMENMCKNVFMGKMYTNVNSGSYNVTKRERRENMKMKQNFEEGGLGV